MSKQNFSVYRYTGTKAIKISNNGQVLGHLIKNMIYSVAKVAPTTLEVVAYLRQRPIKFRLSISKTNVSSLLERSEILSIPMAQVRAMLTPAMNTPTVHALLPPVGRLGVTKDFTHHRRMFGNLVSRLTLATSTINRERAWSIDNKAQPLPVASIPFRVKYTKVDFTTHYNAKTGQFQLRFTSHGKRIAFGHMASLMSKAVVEWLERDIGLSTLVPPAVSRSEIAYNGDVFYNYTVSFLV